MSVIFFFKDVGYERDNIQSDSHYSEINRKTEKSTWNIDLILNDFKWEGHPGTLCVGVRLHKPLKLVLQVSHIFFFFLLFITFMQLAPDQYVDVKVVIISWNNFIPLIPLLHSKIQYAAIPWTLVIIKKY